MIFNKSVIILERSVVERCAKFKIYRSVVLGN